MQTHLCGGCVMYVPYVSVSGIESLATSATILQTSYSSKIHSLVNTAFLRHIYQSFAIGSSPLANAATFK